MPKNTFRRAGRRVFGLRLAPDAADNKHVCGRPFDPAQRAGEQQAAAEKAINAQMASMEQSAKRSVEHTAQPTQRDVGKTNKYSNLLRF